MRYRGITPVLVSSAISPAAVRTTMSKPINNLPSWILSITFFFNGSLVSYNIINIYSNNTKLITNWSCLWGENLGMPLHELKETLFHHLVILHSFFLQEKWARNLKQTISITQYLVVGFEDAAPLFDDSNKLISDHIKVVLALLNKDIGDRKDASEASGQVRAPVPVLVERNLLNLQLIAHSQCNHVLAHQSLAFQSGDGYWFYLV